MLIIKVIDFFYLIPLLINSSINSSIFLFYKCSDSMVNLHNNFFYSYTPCKNKLTSNSLRLTSPGKTTLF